MFVVDSYGGIYEPYITVRKVQIFPFISCSVSVEYGSLVFLPTHTVDLLKGKLSAQLALYNKTSVQ